tara:strand:+ start:462 stop:605 length:144 start_codon:yes stop_codon:yes gene_type:complete
VEKSFLSQYCEAFTQSFQRTKGFRWGDAHGGTDGPEYGQADKGRTTD